MNTLLKLTLILPFVFASAALSEENKTTAEHLQNVSVTIRSEGSFSNGEGSGVIFTRKDAKGNQVNFVWTAAHVIDNLRKTRETVVNGSPKTLVEFKDPMVVKEIRQNGRTVGRLQMDAEVLKYSDAKDGHDLALLRVRKFNFVKGTVTFYLEDKIPPLGEDLLHVGSLLGQMGANSMTDGIYSQHGRLIKSLNKFVFDQTTCTAFPGSSGGGVYLKGDARYVGMLVRGAGEGFNLIVPVRRMVDYCEKHKIMWALDPKVAMPSEDDLNKMPIEHEPKAEEDKGEDTADEKAAKKMFPHMLRVTYPKLLIIDKTR
ncbi:MAG: trypsin-like peptidase domain-containing protein [Bacteroidetes bacterium]|nr:trypsin-like peptidase domain-containing protein [Bacteroidota bacterium]